MSSILIKVNRQRQLVSNFILGTVHLHFPWFHCTVNLPESSSVFFWFSQISGINLELFTPELKVQHSLLIGYNFVFIYIGVLTAWRMKEHITACIIAAFWPYTNSSPKHESWKKKKNLFTNSAYIYMVQYVHEHAWPLSNPLKNKNPVRVSWTQHFWRISKKMYPIDLNGIFFPYYGS